MVTWGFAVCRDPDTGWSNWGMYRFMLLDGQHLSGQPTPLSNFAHIFREKYMARNRPMPLAIAIGADPLSCMASTTGYRPDEDEADFAGALHGAPVPLVKCVSNDLLVPADSEIVIEGEVPPDAAGLEGPFGEYPGYRIGGVSPKILFNVLAMTHRRDPILTMCVHGVPTDEGHAGGAIGAALGFKRRMQRAELPVLDVTLPPEGASHIVAVSVSRGGPEVAQAVKEIVTQNRAWHTKIIIVDADVDVFNMNEVIHALAVKCHSWRGITLSEEPGKGNPFTPCYTPEERAVRHGAVALFDCTWPPELPEDLHPQKSSFREIYPPDLQARIIRDWRDYGFRSKL